MAPKVREWVSTLTVHAPSELSDEDQALLREAHQAAAGAYAPYSHFQVGGAVRLADGVVVRGSNQENMAYPSGSPSPNAIADAFMPCGGCRQVLVEAERRQGTPLRVILQVRDEEVMISDSAINLVPFAFEAKGLGLEK